MMFWWLFVYMLLVVFFCCCLLCKSCSLVVLVCSLWSVVGYKECICYGSVFVIVVCLSLCGVGFVVVGIFGGGSGDKLGVFLFLLLWYFDLVCLYFVCVVFVSLFWVDVCYFGGMWLVGKVCVFFLIGVGMMVYVVIFYCEFIFLGVEI